jgi:DNA-binding NarL/FixJ family response regulator
MPMCKRSHPCRFLFIEDDDIIQRQAKVYADILLDDGMIFVVASTLAEGLQMLQDTSRPPFDAILLDPGLPDADGDEGYKAVRKINPHIDVVVYTGRIDQAFSDLLVHQGAERVLFKGQWTFMQVATLLHYAASRGRALRRERERCRRAEESAADLQSLVDSLATNPPTPEVISRVTRRIEEIQGEVKSLAA